MTEQEIQAVLSKQKEFFQQNQTRDIQKRYQYLNQLYNTLKSHEDIIANALKEDLGKSPAESYMCETGLAMSEIHWQIKHLYSLTKEHRVATPLAQYVSRSYQKPSPYGQVLIMSPWNYPILLSIDPVAEAVAAGNTVVLKPSAYAPASAKVLKDIIESVFPSEWVTVVTGGRKENTALLDQKWDFIFFTGSQTVGKLVLTKAAPHLTPVVLELGGKSPCIVDNTAKINLAAKRIVWGKFLNCGQTCVAPDYILVQKNSKEKLIEALKREIVKQFGEDPLQNPDYGKIINEKHRNRLSQLMDENKIIYGGQTNDTQIAPTLMDDITWDDAVMKQEIFGPILPILTFDSVGDIPNLLQDKPKPLAFYLFSENKDTIQYLTDVCQFGGGCINDTIIHLATSNMPFGGVGESGMGSYHGKKGFETFSHYKSIVDKKTWIDLPMRYQPFSKSANKLVHLFMK